MRRRFECAAATTLCGEAQQQSRACESPHDASKARKHHQHRHRKKTLDLARWICSSFPPAAPPCKRPHKIQIGGVAVSVAVVCWQPPASRVAWPWYGRVDLLRLGPASHSQLIACRKAAPSYYVTCITLLWAIPEPGTICMAIVYRYTGIPVNNLKSEIWLRTDLLARLLFLKTRNTTPFHHNSTQINTTCK